jgi:hypothetical protein
MEYRKDRIARFGNRMGRRRFVPDSPRGFSTKDEEKKRVTAPPASAKAPARQRDPCPL